MAQQTISNGESGASVRAKLNANLGLTEDDADLTELGDSIPEIDCSFIFMSSSFSGWGSAVGAWQGVKAVSFYVRPFISTHLITSVRARVLRTNSEGEVLGDKTVTGITTELGVKQLITVEFDDVIANAENDELWVEFYTNGRTGAFGRIAESFLQPPYPQNRYATNSSVSTLVTAENATDLEIFFRLHSADARLNFSDAFRQGVKNQLALTDIEIDEDYAVQISLPSQLIAVEGREFNIYFDNVIDYNKTLHEFDVNVTCSKGSQFDDRFTITPTSSDAGTFNFTLDVSKNGVLIATTTVSLIIVALTAGSGVARKALVIGDSTTEAATPLAELVNLYDGDVMTLTLVGTKGSGAVVHEGVSGKDFGYFYSNVASPFVFSGSFNFSSYLSTNGITMAADDWVIFNLGINDIFGVTDEESLNTNIANIKTYLAAMMANIKSAVSGIRIGVCIPILPSKSQDSFGDDYGNGQTRPHYVKNAKRLARDLIEFCDFTQRRSEDIYVIPLNIATDTTNNMFEVLTEVNARADVARSLEVESVVWQAGNVIRYTFSGSPNLSAGRLNYFLVVEDDATASNNGKFQIVNINHGAYYVDVINTGRSSSTGDVASGSSATAKIRKTRMMQSNGVHPDTAGYEQIADTYFAFLKQKA